MPETFTAVGTYFGAAGGTAAVGTAGEATLVGTELAGNIVTGDALAGLGAGTLPAAAGTTGGVLGAVAGSQFGQSAGGALVGQVASSALQPRAPGAKTPSPMPDPLAQEEARRRAVIDQLARRGRTSTVLTDQTDKLGG